MDCRALIEESLRYIEEHLDCPITARELADMAGYSLYRYYRLFQSAVGLPVMRYILRRRLLRAVAEVRRGSRQIDAALRYGFDTHAGFYRAFRREYGCTPSQYLKYGGAPASRPIQEVMMEKDMDTAARAMTAEAFYEDPENARMAGRTLGRLHRQLAGAELTVDEVDLYETVSGWALPACRGLLGLSDTFCRDYLDRLGRLAPLLPTQIIHRDPNPSSFLVSDNGWTLAASPLAERNVRIYDPCYAATAILSESFDESRPERLSRWLEICRGILSGYDETAVLSEEERRAVPDVILANQFICTAWFREQGLEPELFEVNRKMTVRILSEFDRLTRDLI